MAKNDKPLYISILNKWTGKKPTFKKNANKKENKTTKKNILEEKNE